MKIHEYQAKQIFRSAGVPAPEGIVVQSPQEAANAFAMLRQPTVVLKAQIHAGGRGKGTIADVPGQHGVERVDSSAKAAEVARNLLGHRLVTVQTGPRGQVVRRILVEATCPIERELYAAIVVDRSAAAPTLIVSPCGGMDIERVAAESPKAIFRETFEPDRGLHSFQARRLAGKLGLSGALAHQFDTFARRMASVFVECDCTLVEVNPLVVTADSRLLALDAKIDFDDNGLFRHPELAELRDLAEEDPAEVHAGEEDLSYVKLAGNIGCLVNGAGLAMSTMDLIKLHGGEPANFLDVGGGANLHQVTEAFSILLGDTDVRAVLVNIFGGIMRCTTVAEAIVAAYRSVGFNVPLVVRLEGTEVDAGRRILAEAGVNIITAATLTEAAEKVVAAARREPQMNADERR